MVGFLSGLLLLIGCIAIGAETYPESVQHGLEQSKVIFDGLQNSVALQQLAPTIGEKTVPFMEAVAYLWDRQAVSQDAEELRQVSDTLQGIHIKLDALNVNFEDVKSIVELGSVTSEFHEYEKSIQGLRQNLLRVLTSPSSPLKVQNVDFFSKQFESDYQNAASKLYRSVVDDKFIFGTNLLEAVRKSTQNHRLQTQRFALGVYKLFVSAAEVETAYIALNQQTDNYRSYVQTYWQPMLLKLQEKLNQIDEEIRGFYLDQVKAEVQAFISAKKMTGWYKINENLLAELLEKVRQKFDGRDWVVLAFEQPLGGRNKMAVFTCEELVFHLNRQFTVVLGSRDTKARADRNEIIRNIQKLPKSLPTFAWSNKAGYLVSELSRLVSDDTTSICQTHPFMAVIADGVAYATRQTIQVVLQPIEAISGLSIKNRFTIFAM